VRDELKEGQQIMVKCIGKEGNKIKLSRKAVLRQEKQMAAGADGGQGIDVDYDAPDDRPVDEEGGGGDDGGQGAERRPEGRGEGRGRGNGGGGRRRR
jgi:polyribonucleotide nucleotidyltransferase